MKRIINMMFMVIIILSLFNVSAFAEEERIIITEFEYVDSEGNKANTLTPEETIKATFKYKGAESLEGEFEFFAALVVYNNYLLEDVISLPLKAEANIESEEQSISYTCPDDVSGIEIAFFVFKDLIKMEPLTSPAYFGNEDASLHTVTVGNNTIYPDDDNTDFDLNLILGKDILPDKIQASAKDLGTNITIPPLSGYFGNFEIKSYSHSGTEKKFGINVITEIENQLTSRLGEKNWLSTSWTIKGLYGGPFSSNITIRSTGELYSGSSRNSFFSFDIPKIPLEFPLESAKLVFYAHANNTADAVTIRAFEAASDWYENEGQKGPDVDTTAKISTEDVVVPADKVFRKYELPLDLNWIKNKEVLNINLVYEYITSKPYVQIQITDPDKLPYIEFVTAEN